MLIVILIALVILLAAAPGESDAPTATETSDQTCSAFRPYGAEMPYVFDDDGNAFDDVEQMRELSGIGD